MYLKGVNIIMTREYMTPDFDVTVYEVEDVITYSIGNGPLEGGNGTDWNG